MMKTGIIARGLALALLFFGVGSSQGALVTLSFTGTYDTGPTTVFGLSGPAVPYNFQITYNTALDTNSLYFPVGSSLGGYTTTQEWYGYSKSGITATSLTFGTQTWTASDIVARIPAVGVSADLWFDSDISVSAPDSSWIFFENPTVGKLQLGGGHSDSINIYLDQTSSLMGDHGASGFSSAMNIDVVPEPSTFAMAAIGLAGLVVYQLAARKSQSIRE